MVYRFLIDQNVFWLTKPGIDVYSVTSQDQLLFDGNYASPARWIKGQVSGSRGGNGSTTVTANFGKTYSSPPMLLVNFTPTSGASFPGESYPMKCFGDSQSPWSNMAFSWMTFEVAVGTASADFKITSFSSSVTFVIDYLVFDYRIGF
jgi:hypothetical protein